MNKLRSLFLENIWWKLVSLTLAIIIWVIGMNINNPELTRNYPVNLTFKNSNKIEENGLILLNSQALLNTNINVAVNATKQKHELLTSSKITAEIDFAPVNITNPDYAGESKSVEVVVTLPTGYEYKYYSPRTVDLKFDIYTDKDFDIEIFKTGKPAENYDTLSNWTVTPSKINLVGSKMDLEKVASITAPIDVSDATDTVSKIVEIIVYDADGNVITDLFEITNTMVKVVVPVYKYATIPITTPSWSGSPNNGYELTEIILDPTFVEVFGAQEHIESLPSIELDPSNVSGATNNVVSTFNINDLLIGTNLNKKNGTPDEIKVTYVVKPIINKTLNVPIENFTMENLNDEVELPTEIEIELSGSENLIQMLNAQSIYGLLDFSMYDRENGNVNVTILDLPQGIKFNGPKIINVKVENNEENSVDEELTTEEILPINTEEDIEVEENIDEITE